MVFGFEFNDEAIGTIRIVPMGYGMTLTDVLVEQLDGEDAAVVPGSWEVGRLVLGTQYRSDVDTLRHCLYIALKYARAHAHMTCMYASCTPVLSRLYRRFGFTAFARDVPLPGTSKTYTLIRGATPTVLEALGGGGVDAR